MLAWADGNWVGGALLLAGGAGCAFGLLRTGRQAWGLMPPGSTPRLILAVVGGVLALWVAASVTTGPDAPLRFAVIAVLALMAARLLQGHSATSVLTAAAGLTLVLGAASQLGPNEAGIAPYLLAALIAAGASFLPVAEKRGA